MDGKRLHIYSHPAKHEIPTLQRRSGRVSSPFTPFQAVLGHRLSQEVARLCRSTLRSCRATAAPAAELQTSAGRSGTASGPAAGLPPAPQRDGSESRPLAADVGTRTRGGSRGGSAPRQGLGVPVGGEGILPEELMGLLEAVS